jgi:hypothetical protein
LGQVVREFRLESLDTITQLDAIWEQPFPAEQSRVVQLLAQKGIIWRTDLEVRLRANGIERWVLKTPQTAGDAQEAA